MDIHFNNLTCLITGGTRGIGKSIVEAFLNSGATVIYTGRDEDRKVFASEKAIYMSVDFQNDSSIEKFLEMLKGFKIDILVNNAGINKIDVFGEIDIDDFKKIQKVNVETPFRLCRELAPLMAERKFGRIVNIASIFSKVSKEKRASYSTSKFALVGMSKALAIDYAESNVLTNVISPGFIDTELTRTVLSELEIEKLTSQVPMKRLGKANEIANWVLFLCSDKNTFMNGQNIVVDGGFTCV